MTRYLSRQWRMLISFLLLLFSLPLAGLAQSPNIPYPIIFVHGLCSNNQTWSNSSTSIISYLTGAGYVFGGNLDYSLDYQRTTAHFNTTKTTDVHAFTPSLFVKGDLYTVNFSTRRDGTNTPINAQAVLSQPAFAGDAQLNVNQPSQFKANDIIRIDNEFMLVTGVSGYFLTVTRSQVGTVAANHLTGNDPIYNLSNEGNQASIVKQGYALKLAIDAIKAKTGAKKVILVGHSMGGLAAREYIRSYFNNDVAKIVTIGTPHYGTDITSDFPAFILNGFLAGVDLRSEAIRDLRAGINGNLGEYLFGGSESAITGYYSSDIDCNGLETDQIVGLDTDIGYANLKLMDRTWIASDITLGTSSFNVAIGTDGVVPTSKQYISPLDTIMTNKTHGAETGDYLTLIRGIDEPSDPALAYEIAPNSVTKGFITFGKNYQAADVDLYKVTLTSATTLTFNISGNSSTGIKSVDLLDASQNPKATITNINLPLSSALPAGTYYLRINGVATGASINYPYTITASASGTSACVTPATAPIAVYGSDACTNGTSLYGTVASLSFNPQGGVSYSAQVSQYPYSSANIIFTSLCQTSTAPIVTKALTPGMLYRWNMYSYGATDCSSCKSTVSNSKYFSIPPVISSTGTQLNGSQPVTISTAAQTPGTGSLVNYRWLKNGAPLQSGNQLTSIQVSAVGDYSLIIDYSGSTNGCGGTVSTYLSNVITVGSNPNCIASVAPVSVSQTPSGNLTILTVTGGSLGTGGTWNWYTGSCGGTFVGAGTVLTVNPSVNTTYYVRAEGSCNITTCASVTINLAGNCIASTPVQAINQSTTGNVTSLLLIGGSLGTNAGWVWYQGSCGGPVAGTGNLITVSPTVPTTYYVRPVGDCGIVPCDSVTVIPPGACVPSATPLYITQSDVNDVSGLTKELTIVGGSLGTNATWRWFNTTCGGTVYASGHTNSIDVDPNVAATYYVRAEGDCGVTDCVSTTVTPCILSVKPDALSYSQTGRGILLQISGGSLGTNASWAFHSGTCDGPIIGSGHADTLRVFPTSETIYFVNAIGCNVTDCVSLDVIPAPVISSFSPQSAIPGTIVTIIGNNFNAATAVTFGGVPATSFTVNSPNSITATVGVANSGDIEVTTSKGTTNLSGFNFVFNLPSGNFKIGTSSATCKGNADGIIRVSTQQSLHYSYTLVKGDLSLAGNFPDSVSLTNLAAGAYHLCLSVDGYPDYQQCFDLVITEPQELSVFSSLDPVKQTLTLNLSGSDIYHIQLNGLLFNTSQQTYTLQLVNGDNSIVITTDRQCQGIYQKVFNSSDKIIPYPDPFEDVLNLNLGNNNIAVLKVSVTNLENTTLLYSKQFSGQSGILSLDLSGLPKGVYALKLIMDNRQKIFKIIKQ